MDEVACRKTVAELRAVAGKRPKSIIGLHRGRIRIKGEILGPIDVSWKALE
jgi:hypothetical protein